MFDNTTTAWSRPWVKAAIVNDQPRITIEIVLVAAWNDSLNSAWRKDGNAKSQVLVELDEDEIRAFLELLDFGIPHKTLSVRASLRDRLKAALAYLP